MDISEELNLRTGTKGAEILNEAEGIVEAFVSGVGNKDSVGDIVEPGAFNKSLERRHPRVIWSHDWNIPVGKVLEIYEVGADDPRLPAKMKKARIGGLYAKVQFNLLSEKGREAFASVAFFGQDQEWSIGYKTLRSKFDPMVKANRLQEVELFEVSPVLHGANQLTGTVSVKSGEELAAEKAAMMAAPTMVEDMPQTAYSDEEEEKGHEGSMIPAMLSRMMGDAEVTILMTEKDKIIFKVGDKTYMMKISKIDGRMMFSMPYPVTINVEPMTMERKEDEEEEEEEEMPEAAPAAPVAPSVPMGNLIVKVVDADIALSEIDVLKVLNVKVEGDEIHFLSTDDEDVLKKMVSEALFSAGVKSVEGRRA